MRFVALGLALLAVGCTSATGPDEKREVGVILGLANEAPAIEVPSPVRVGQDFTVTIRTGWRNGCARADGTEVEVRGATATITPYERITESTNCTQASQEFIHRATLRFDQPALVELTIRGRRSFTASVITVRRTVEVRP
ncbi:MAG TPA: hypothetical protein VF625_07885 [Longimicrobium sp.]|jgi:hypothetical protein